MRSTTGQQVLLVLASALIFFVNLGEARLWDDDEPKNAQCAREMFERGDFIVPTFNGELRHDKPVLVYWLMMSAYRLFGVTEFAARFWSAVAAIGTTLATYHLGRILFSARVGFWAGWIMASSLMFVIAGRAATPDSLLIFCTTLAMLAFVRATWGVHGTLAGANRLTDFLPKSWAGMAAVYAAMALGVLAKGPVALVLPTLMLVVYTVAVRQCLTAPSGASPAGRCARLLSPIAWCVAAWQLRPLTAVLVLAGIALPWYIAVGVKTDGDWLAGFLGYHNVARYLTPMEGHRGPFLYYVAAVLFGFFPWSTFLPQALVRAWRQACAAGNWAVYLFLGCWAGVWIGFFSFSGTKLPSYVTPAYPALALMTAAWIDSWIAAPEKVNRWFLRQSIASLLVVGLALAALLPILSHYVLPGEAVLGVVGLTLVIGGVPALAWSVHQPRRAAAALAATSLAFFVVLFGFGAVRISRHQNSAALIDLLHPSNSPLATADLDFAAFDFAAFDFTVPSLVYYSQRHVPQFKQAEDAVNYLQESPQALLMTYTHGYETLRPLLPHDVTVIARRQRFLRRSEVILLGRASALGIRVADSVGNALRGVPLRTDGLSRGDSRNATEGVPYRASDLAQPEN